MNRSLAARLFDNDWVGPALVTLLAIVIITIFQPGFLSPFNIQVLLSAIANNMMIALGQLVIIGIGQMNLSLGTLGGLVAISFAGLMQVYNLDPILAMLVAAVIGIIGGAINGWIIARTGISAFIITLATLQLYKGINLGITQAQPFYGVPDSVKTFGNTVVFGPIPWLVVPMAIVAVGVWIILNRLRIGRYMLAYGGNRTAAELSGMSTTATIVWAHALSGLLAAIAGMMLVARLQLGQPTIGDDWLIASFAAPVIGGAVLAGGQVSVVGTFFGVVIIAIITQALVIFAINPFVVQIVLGALILWAIGMNRLRELRVARMMGRRA
jgi:ribose transport system permease protein